MVRKGERVKFWTQEEENALRDLYKDHTHKEIAEILNRTAPSINRKVMRLHLRKKPRVWTEDEQKRLGRMYKSGRKRKNIALALGRTESAVKQKASELGFKGKLLVTSQRKGVEGEKIAIKVFRELGWKIKEMGDANSAFDFILETENEETYAVNLKFGKSMLVSERNIKRLVIEPYPSAFFFILESGEAFFMPIISKSPRQA